MIFSLTRGCMIPVDQPGKVKRPQLSECGRLSERLYPYLHTRVGRSGLFQLKYFDRQPNQGP